MQVLKFGGTSVGTPESLQQVGRLLQSKHEQGEELCVVVSALGGATNRLIDMSQMAAESDEAYQTLLATLENRHYEVIKALISVRNQSPVFAQTKRLVNQLEDVLQGVYLVKELSPRTTDVVLSFGERLSATIITAYLNELGLPAETTDARELILTDDHFGNANVHRFRSYENIRRNFDARDKLQVITGFIGATEKQETTTLGRGGSDYTAALFGAALHADLIEIWTDVDGMMTADPRLVKKAFSLPSVSYVEAMELSHFGAKVIYPPTLQPAFTNKIPLRVRNTFNPDFEGTLITDQPEEKRFPIRGISSIPDISLVNLQGSGLVGVAGTAGRLFTTLAENGINVILISQASSEHSICFAVRPEDSERACQVVNKAFEFEIEKNRVETAKIEAGLSVISIIGDHMRHTPGVAGRYFGNLERNGINVVATAQGSSEINMSTVIRKQDLSKALNILHEAFFLSETKTLNLFLVGPGLIGTTLLNQVLQQREFLAKNRNLVIRLVGVINSKQMLIEPEGLPLESWETRFEESGQEADLGTFVEEMKRLNLPNSVFSDCTANPNIVPYYQGILEESIAIVTPNKVANSGPYERYRSLKDTARRHQTQFLYETNVGAGLPIINTLSDLIYSGDRIQRIEAILSGTISYIFNNFAAEKPFYETVREAKELGFTEPDPREDLSGADIHRKILILAREIGLELEPNDIPVQNILPESCLLADSIEEFFRQLEKENAYFEKLRQDAEAEGKRLRLIATIEEEKASVSLQAVDGEHPFYHMKGSDNIIAFTTERYKEESPLIVKGPGAGAEVTAAGVFSEIIETSKYM